jgi:hypothetical protein
MVREVALPFIAIFTVLVIISRLQPHHLVDSGAVMLGVVDSRAEVSGVIQCCCH